MPKPHALKRLGRTLITGTAQDIADALDEAIAPESMMLERLSDLVTMPIARAIVRGRGELVAGIREALAEVPG